LNYPELTVDRTVFLRDGSKCHTVLGLFGINVREINAVLIHQNYNNDLTHNLHSDKDIMVIMNNGKTEWERPAEEVWKEITIDELLKLTEPVKIKIIKENEIIEGAICYNQCCTNCQIESDYDCNCNKISEFDTYRNAIKIEIKVDDDNTQKNTLTENKSTWIRSNGDEVLIEDMTDLHIKNTIAKIEKGVAEIEWIEMCKSGNKLEQLKAELNKRRDKAHKYDF
jgi:hypothetical protein